MYNQDFVSKAHSFDYLSIFSECFIFQSVHLEEPSANKKRFLQIFAKTIAIVFYRLKSTVL